MAAIMLLAIVAALPLPLANCVRIRITSTVFLLAALSLPFADCARIRITDDVSVPGTLTMPGEVHEGSRHSGALEANEDRSQSKALIHKNGSTEQWRQNLPPSCSAVNFDENYLRCLAEIPSLAQEPVLEDNKEKRMVDSTKPQVQFVIGGAQKGGTTYLNALLSKHPNITMPENEMHFFDTKYQRLSFEDYRHKVCGESHGIVCGEKTPSYSLTRTRIDRIARDFPEMKWVLALREPVSRALAQYNMYMVNHEPSLANLSFEDALSLERAPFVDSFGVNFDYRQGQSWYIQRGIYMRQIKYLLTKFPRDQLYIVTSDDMHDKQNFDQKALFSFLGVPYDKQIILPDQFVKHSENVMMKPETKSCLQEFFADYNEELFNFLQRPVPESWKSPSSYLIEYEHE